MFARAKAKAKPKQNKQHTNKREHLFCFATLHFLAPEFRPQKRKAKSAKRCDCLPHQGLFYSTKNAGLNAQISWASSLKLQSHLVTAKCEKNYINGKREMRIRNGSNGQRTDIPLLHTSPYFRLRRCVGASVRRCVC